LLPFCIEDVTSTWLTDVLVTSGALPSEDRISTMAHEPVGVGIGLLSQLHRVSYRSVVGDRGSVVVKLPATNEHRSTADTLGLYRRELDFYRDVASAVPLRTPRAYLAEQADASTDFVLVLEDLGGLTPGDQIRGLRRDRAEVAVDTVAGLHRWAWEGRERLHELSDRFRPLRNETVRAMYPGYFTAGWANYRCRAERLPAPALTAAADRWVEALPWFLDELAEPATLCHGDLRADNLFFDANGSVVTIDFQLAHQGCGISDVAYLGSQSIEGASADDHEALVRRYCHALEQLGISYPLADAQRQYRVGVLFHLVEAVVATLSWPSLDPHGRQLVLRLVERAGRAIEVTDALSLLPR
jgi:hypothetical protein